MQETDAHPFNVNHTTVYAHCICSWYGLNIRKCGQMTIKAMTTDLIV